MSQKRYDGFNCFDLPVQKEIVRTDQAVADYLEQFETSPYQEPNPQTYQNVPGKSTLKGSWQPPQ